MHRLRRVCRRVPERIGDAFHRGESFASRAFASGETGANQTRHEYGPRDGRGRFRQLHEHLRMRSSLPGRNQRELYCETESRIFAGEFETQRRRIIRAPRTRKPRSRDQVRFSRESIKDRHLPCRVTPQRRSNLNPRSTRHRLPVV